MLNALTRSFKAFCVIVVTVLFLTFAVSNREVVNISLFPLPYAADLPVFLLSIICFALGVIIGGIIMSFKFSKSWRQARSEHKRVEALENQISAMRSERPTFPAIANKS